MSVIKSLAYIVILNRTIWIRGSVHSGSAFYDTFNLFFFCFMLHFIKKSSSNKIKETQKKKWQLFKTCSSSCDTQWWRLLYVFKSKFIIFYDLLCFHHWPDFCTYKTHAHNQQKKKRKKVCIFCIDSAPTIIL